MPKGSKFPIGSNKSRLRMNKTLNGYYSANNKNKFNKPLRNRRKSRN